MRGWWGKGVEGGCEEGQMGKMGWNCTGGDERKGQRGEREYSNNTL